MLKTEIPAGMTVFFTALTVLFTNAGNAREAPDPLMPDSYSSTYREVFLDKKVDRIVTSWYHGFYLTHLPESVRKRYSDMQWSGEQENYLRESAGAGIEGPFMPWMLNNLGEDAVNSIHRQYDLNFPLFLHSGWHSQQAMKQGAKFILDNSVACWDSAYCAAAQAFRESWLRDHASAPWLSMVIGRDEPLNFAASVRNPAVVGMVNADLKRRYGVRLGLSPGDSAITWAEWPTDPNIAGQPSQDVALLRIALWRWLNGRLHDAAFRERENIKKYLPDTPYFAYNRNAINIRDVLSRDVRHSIDFLDQALMWDVTDGFSADPYPTVVLARDGRGRTVWHTGFTAKLVVDLAAGKPAKMILQAFAFDGLRPTPENLREWASQAAKAGTVHLEWYTHGNTRFAWPDIHAELLRLSRLWKDMPALDIPQTAQVAVIFSDDSRAASNDAALHQYYTLHVLLGEKLGAWFAFTGENHVRRGLQNLDSAKLIIAPALSHVSRDFVAVLARKVRSGATLLLLDPGALSWDIETGSLAMERLGLLGSSLGNERGASSLFITDDGRRRFGNIGPLPLQAGPDGVPARSLSALPGAMTLFTFADGSPAVYSRSYGDGEVIVFGARPFGNSELALAPAGWDRLFAALLDEHGVRRDLPLWRFRFPARGGEVKTFKPLVPYETK